MHVRDVDVHNASPGSAFNVCGEGETSDCTHFTRLITINNRLMWLLAISAIAWPTRAKCNCNLRLCHLP